jgi:predicted metalloprotease with PDZ domain
MRHGNLKQARLRHGLWLALCACSGWLAAAQSATFSGPILLQVDATDTDRRLLHVVETIPATAGKMSLYYPQWLPGNHAPRGPIEQLTGLVFRGGDRVLNWNRDPLNVYRFEVDVPAGITQITAEFQVATPQAADQGRIVITTDLLGLQWNQVLLYPQGFAAGDIPVLCELPPRQPEAIRIRWLSSRFLSKC